MATQAAYDTRHRPGLASADSYAGSRTGQGARPMACIRAALIARGTTLRQWAHAYAAAKGEAPDRVYLTLRMTIQRRLDRGLPPTGPIGQRLVDALRADLGADLVPRFAAPTGRRSPRRRVAGLRED